MFLAKLFSKSRFIDADLETNLLFSPNYLIREYAIKNGMQYVFGGHSVINIHKENGLRQLNFVRTRSLKANKLAQQCELGVKMGFRSIGDQHYFLFEHDPHSLKLAIGDTLSLEFENGATLTFTISLDTRKTSSRFGAKENETYIPITLDNLGLFKSQKLASYAHAPIKAGRGMNCLLTDDFTEALREVAETYQYAIENHYPQTASA